MTKKRGVVVFSRLADGAGSGGAGELSGRLAGMAFMRRGVDAAASKLEDEAIRTRTSDTWGEESARPQAAGGGRAGRFRVVLDTASTAVSSSLAAATAGHLSFGKFNPGFESYQSERRRAATRAVDTAGSGSDDELDDANAARLEAILAASDGAAGAAGSKRPRPEPEDREEEEEDAEEGAKRRRREERKREKKERKERKEWGVEGVEGKERKEKKKASRG
jgi:hypothetical protein